MAAQVNPKQCTVWGGLPDAAIWVQDNRVVVTEFSFEDCNECGSVCPDRVITVSVDRIRFNALEGFSCIPAK